MENPGEASRLVRRHRDCSWTVAPYERTTDECERESDSMWIRDDDDDDGVDIAEVEEEGEPEFRSP